MSTEEPFCGETIQKVYHHYDEIIQGYIDIPICIIGSIFNLFNILVFTRRNMISPMNLIFANLAFVDLSVLLAYTLKTWLDFTRYNSILETYIRAVLSIRSRELLIISHYISVYLTMALVIWKYIAILHPLKESRWCNMKTTRNTVIVGYITCILLFIPAYLSRVIVAMSINETTTVYTSIGLADSITYSMSQIIDRVLFELLPSVVLPILSVRLIVVLAKKDHSNLPSNMGNGVEKDKTKQQTDRSIMILMTLVALRLTYVIPTGLYELVHTTLTYDKYLIHHECLNSLYIILNVLNCINRIVTFIIYYAMDQDFKVTFKLLFNKNNISIEKRKYFVLSTMRRNDGSPEIDQV